MRLGVRKFFLLPNEFEKAARAAVVDSPIRAAFVLDDVDATRHATPLAMPIQLGQCARPIGQIAKIE